MQTKDLFSLENTIAKELLCEFVYPWETLSHIKEFIIKKGKTLDKKIYTKVSENVWIANSVKIAKTAEINGPAIIGENCEIRPSAYIRGSVIIGDNCVVGNSTEIKNSIIFNSVQIPHYNYIGDSVLGFKAHFGAGAITSNVKSDKTLVTVKNGNERIETGLKKFGAMVGDNTEIGCNSVLCPGTILGKNCTVYPLSMVRGYIKENSIFKDKDNIITKK